MFSICSRLSSMKGTEGRLPFWASLDPLARSLQIRSGIGGNSMRISRVLACTSMAFLVAGCGGGGSGGVASTPPRPPTPTPTPTNSSITNLIASQTFATDASVANDTFDLTTDTVTSTSVSNDTVTVAYDAATKSYTITTPNRATTFSN